MTGTDRTGLRGLSVRRPWAQLIMAGAKTVENRTWTTNYRGPLVIHAGHGWVDNAERVAAEQGIVISEADAASGWLGVVRLVDVHKADNCCAPWGEPYGYHWVLTAPDRLDAVIPGPGQLGLQPVPDEVLAAIR